MKLDTVYFIAVNYNNISYTQKFIASVLQLSTTVNVNIIIVDNDSCESEKLALDKIKHDNLRIIKNNSNVGYFKALNIGISCALNSYESSDLCRNKTIIVGNNDLEFEEQFVVRLESLKYSSDTLVIAPNVITTDGYNQNPHCITPVSFLRKLGYRVYFSNYYLGQLIYSLTQTYKRLKGPRTNLSATTRQFIYMGIGACYVLTDNFFNNFERLDDRVFLWGEEALLAGQVASVGGKILYEPSLIVYHNENTSVSRIPTRQAYNITKESYKTYSKYL